MGALPALTNSQAAAVAGIVAGADSQCLTCASHLARDLQRVWPQFDWAQLVAEAGEWEREQVARGMV